MTSMCFHDINNLLHDARNALKNCYIISENHLPRPLQPSCALCQAHVHRVFSGLYTRRCRRGWIGSNFALHGMLDDNDYESLFPSHALSPVARSLRLTYIAIAPSHLLGSICSFLLLQDLSVIAWFVDASLATTDGQQTSFKPSKSPAFIGSLEHLVVIGIGFIISRHFLLQNGPYFRRPRSTYLTTHVLQLPVASSPLLLCASPIKSSWNWTAPPPNCGSRTRSV